MTSRYEPDCATIRPLLAELALGALSGVERASALAHLEHCRACALELEQLSATADGLLELAPAIEPPLGFELGVLEARRTRTRPGTRRRARHRRVLVGIAACLLVGAGAGITAIVVGGQPQPAFAQLAAGPLLAGGAARGEVVLSRGNAPFVFMTFSDPGSDAWVSCDVVTSSGKRIPVGSFELMNGSGAWGAPVSLAVSTRVVGAEVRAANGSLLARATLR